MQIHFVRNETGSGQFTRFYDVTEGSVTYRACVTRGKIIHEKNPLWSLVVFAPAGAALDERFALQIKGRLLNHVPTVGDGGVRSTPCGRKAVCLIETRDMPYAHN